MASLQRWFIALPRDKSTDECLHQLNKVISKFSDCQLVKFNLPDLRFGTLDHLMSATDDLIRLQDIAEALITKLIHTATDVLENGEEELNKVLRVYGMPMANYLEKFKWEMTKYQPQLSIRGIEEVIEKQLVQMVEDKAKLEEDYQRVNNKLQQMERYQNCSLVQRNVSLFVRKEDFVQDSEHLTTILVTVPKGRYKEWTNCYERIDREVVPRSSYLVLEDEEFGLFTVTLFKRHVEQFRERARELRFFVKDFVYDDEKIEAERISLFRLRQKRKKAYGPFVKWLRVNFSETYIALVHIQGLLICVECILRYGLPSRFFTVLLTVPQKDFHKVRQALLKEYSYLDESFDSIQDKKSVAAEDVPFVHFKIRAEISDFK